MHGRLFGVITALVAVGAAAVVPLVAAAETPQPQVEARVDYKDGGELAADGRYVYASQGGAAGALRVVDGRTGRVTGTVPCPTTGFNPHPDVAVLRPGLVVLASTGQECAKMIAIFDVSKPSRPVLRGSVDVIDDYMHTVAVHPDGRHLYVNDGGASVDETTPDEAPGTIIDTVDPQHPRVVGTLAVTPTGCHDISFLKQKKRVLAFCAGGATGHVYVWDATKPAAPVQIGSLRVPGTEFVHWARPSPDGKLLLVSDEAFVAHSCDGTSLPGSITIADISVPERASVVGRISPPRGPLPVGGRATDPTFSYGCTSHQFDLIPGTRTGVFSWYRGGMSVVDYSNPASPKELAFYNPSGGEAYDAIWAHGRAWVNDLQLGLTKLRIPGL